MLLYGPHLPRAVHARLLASGNPVELVYNALAPMYETKLPAEPSHRSPLQ